MKGTATRSASTTCSRAFYGDAGRTPAKRLPATVVMPLYVAYNGRAQRCFELARICPSGATLPSTKEGRLV